MQNKGPAVAPADATKIVEIALTRLSAKMSELTNQTMKVYLWKWYPPCRGLSGSDLSTYLVQNGCAWCVSDTKTEPISGKTTVTYVFSRPSAKVYKACVLEFRAATPDINSEELMLEFGHHEIPFPEDVKVIVS